MDKRFRTQLGVLAFYMAFSFLINISSPSLFSVTPQSHYINTSKHTSHYHHYRVAHGARMGPASHLRILKSSIIGGLRANDEVGSAARERPQMKSVNGMCIITSSTNHQRSSAVRQRLHHRQPPPPIHAGLCRGHGEAHG